MNIPVYALLLAVLLPAVYTLPSGFIFAMTGQGVRIHITWHYAWISLFCLQISVNVLAQIIPGSLLPGNPLANMVFKAYAVQTLAESTNFVQDLKLGHYIKVPPRATFLGVPQRSIATPFYSWLPFCTFIVQGIATIMAAFVQVGVKHWIFANVPDICTLNQKDHLTCPHNQVFFTASAVWYVASWCWYVNIYSQSASTSTGDLLGRVGSSGRARCITPSSMPSLSERYSLFPFGYGSAGTQPLGLSSSVHLSSSAACQTSPLLRGSTIRLGLLSVSYSSMSSGSGTLLGGRNSTMLQAPQWMPVSAISFSWVEQDTKANSF
jgi:hypothetical protein